MSGEAREVIIFGLSIDKDIVLLVLGAIIGFGASLGISWINNRSQRKKEEKEKAINIISDTVKFVAKIREEISEIKNMMNYYDELIFKAHTVGEATKQEQKKDAYISKVIDEHTAFYAEEEFQMFQLDRLNNQNIWREFKKLMTAHGEFLRAIVEKEHSEEEESKFEKLYKKFINYCVEISKINAPLRTPGAPDQKKGPAKNG
jgi:CHAT domain-containing protein